MRCVNLIDKSVATFCGLVLAKCEMRNTKCEMQNAEMERTHALRAPRAIQKCQQNAENLLLEISVEFKQTNSKCVRACGSCTNVATSPATATATATGTATVAVCSVPQSMQHESAHNGVHDCVCISQLGSRKQGPRVLAAAAADLAFQ